MATKKGKKTKPVDPDEQPTEVVPKKPVGGGSAPGGNPPAMPKPK